MVLTEQKASIQLQNSLNIAELIFFAVIFSPACTFVQELVIFKGVPLVDSWVMLKPRCAHSWADVLVLAV